MPPPLDDAIRSGDRRSSGEHPPILSEVGVPDATFRQLLWLTGAKLPKGLEIDPAAIDWSKVITLAYQERVFTLLYKQIHQHLAGRKEYADYLPLLRDAQLQNTQRNLALAQETLRVVNAFEARHLPVIAFKGCVLSFQAYGSVAARKAGDIDILVRRHDVRRAAEILGEIGYGPYRERNPAALRGLLALDCEWEFANREKSMVVDLHWEFNGTNSALFLPLAHFWSRHQTKDFCGQLIRCLAREDLILMLCVHATKHHLQILEWIYTIARVVNTSVSVDWETIFEDARCAHVERLLLMGLLITDEIYGLALPDHVRMRVHSDASVRELAKVALEWMMCGFDYLPEPPALRKFFAGTRTGFFAKVNYWIHATFTPTAKDYVVDLPRVLDWCYYVFRGVRLVGESITHLFENPSARVARRIVDRTPEPKLLRVIKNLAPRPPLDHDASQNSPG